MAGWMEGLARGENKLAILLSPFLAGTGEQQSGKPLSKGGQATCLSRRLAPRGVAAEAKLGGWTQVQMRISPATKPGMLGGVVNKAIQTSCCQCSLW